MRVHRVRALLMGGQACVFYGAAEFSRDTDFAVLADARADGVVAGAEEAAVGAGAMVAFEQTETVGHTHLFGQRSTAAGDVTFAEVL